MSFPLLPPPRPVHACSTWDGRCPYRGDEGLIGRAVVVLQQGLQLQ